MSDIINSDYGFLGYEFQSETRQCEFTAYADRQWGYYSGIVNHCPWFLRSPDSDGNYVGNVDYDCFISGNCVEAYEGIRPAIYVNLSSPFVSFAGTVSSMLESPAHTHFPHDGGKFVKEATCNAAGEFETKCECGATYIEAIPRNLSNHVGGTEVRGLVAASVGVAGYTGDTHCKGCGVLLSKGSEIPALAPSPITQQALKIQTITVKNKTAKYKTLKKKKVTVKLGAKTDGDGVLSYKITKYPKGMKKYISVSKAGTVTLKKKAKKGIYKITISAAKTDSYDVASKVVTIQVK